MTKHTDYTVGYGKPPDHGKFRPGQSGNAQGRKKKLGLGLDQLVRDELNTLVSVHHNGATKKMRKLEIIVRQAIDQAAKGNFRFLKLLTEMTAFRSIMDNPEARPWNSEQKKFLDRVREDALEIIAERQAKAETSPKDHGPSF